jgi:hypothetical protein
MAACCLDCYAEESPWSSTATSPAAGGAIAALATAAFNATTGAGGSNTTSSSTSAATASAAAAAVVSSPYSARAAAAAAATASAICEAPHISSGGSAGAGGWGLVDGVRGLVLGLLGAELAYILMDRAGKLAARQRAKVRGGKGGGWVGGDSVVASIDRIDRAMFD